MKFEKLKRTGFFTYFFFQVLFLTIATPGFPATYAAYRTWAQGTARILSMGGAFAAVGDDASNIWNTPAMIPLKNTGVNVLLTQGQAFSTDYNSLFNDQTQKTFRSGFNTTTATYVFPNRLFIGLGDGDPFSEGPDNPSFGNSFLKLHETRISVGSTISSDMAIAMTLINRFMVEQYQGYAGAVATGPSVQQSSQAVNINLSLAWEPVKNLISSASWEQGQEFGMQNPTGLVSAGMGIQPVRIPTLMRAGLSKRLPDAKLLISGELDLLTATANLSGFIDSQNIAPQTMSVDNFVVVPRVALEHKFLERTWIRSVVRGGYYNEPPRFQQDRARDHMTLGIESKLWILDVNFAFDHAVGYSNAATSLGISLSDYL